MGTQHLTVTSTTGFCELFHEFELCSDEILALLQNLDDDNNSNLFNVADTPGPIMMNKKRTSNKSKKRKKPAQSTSSYSLRLCSDEESDEGHAVLSRRKNVKRQKAYLSPPTTCMESRSGEDSGGVGESNTNNNGNVVSHIAVERNRRKQMNEHLAVLRQLMPCFYVKKGDQASIVGGVIDYIDELHHVLQSLEAKKRRKIYTSEVGQSQTPKVSNMMMSSQSNNNNSVANELVVRSNSDLADVEVKFRGPNLELTTLSSKIAGQTCKIVSAIEDLSLEILQLSVNAVEEAMLNTFIIKIGIDCQLSAEELAQQIQQTFC